MSDVQTRWATILKKNANGLAEVTMISQMEGRSPPSTRNPAFFEVQRVDDYVQTGMIRLENGRFDWPPGHDLYRKPKAA